MTRCASNAYWQTQARDVRQDANDGTRTCDARGCTRPMALIASAVAHRYIVRIRVLVNVLSSCRCLPRSRTVRSELNCGSSIEMNLLMYAT